MQAFALLLRWGSYHWARNLWVLIIYLSFLSVMLPSVVPRLTRDSTGRVFLGIWKLLSFQDPVPGTELRPDLFVSLFVFYIFAYLLLKRIASFLGASCPLLAFRSCFVEFTQRLNVLLMNLWKRK